MIGMISSFTAKDASNLATYYIYHAYRRRTQRGVEEAKGKRHGIGVLKILSPFPTPSKMNSA
jgi:hypothetical protein